MRRPHSLTRQHGGSTAGQESAFLTHTAPRGRGVQPAQRRIGQPAAQQHAQHADRSWAKATSQTQRAAFAGSRYARPTPGTAGRGARKPFVARASSGTSAGGGRLQASRTIVSSEEARTRRCLHRVSRGSPACRPHTRCPTSRVTLPTKSSSYGGSSKPEDAHQSVTTRRNNARTDRAKQRGQGNEPARRHPLGPPRAPLTRPL